MTRRVTASGLEVETGIAGKGRVTARGLEVEARREGAKRRITALGLMVEVFAGRTTLMATPALYGYGMQEYGDYDTPDVVDLVMARADTIHGNRVKMTGCDLVIAFNGDPGAAHLVHIESARDPYLRYEDIDYWLGPREYAAFGPFEPDGWIQADRYLYVDADHWIVELGTVMLGRG